MPELFKFGLHAIGTSVAFFAIRRTSVLPGLLHFPLAMEISAGIGSLVDKIDAEETWKSIFAREAGLIAPFILKFALRYQIDLATEEGSVLLMGVLLKLISSMMGAVIEEFWESEYYESEPDEFECYEAPNQYRLR